MAEPEELGIIDLEESLDDVQKPPELPNNTYRAEVQDVQIGHSQAGNDYYAVRFRIPQSEIPSDMQEFFDDGAVLTYNRILVPDGKDQRRLWNVKQFMRALGLSTKVTQIDPNDWMGRECKVIVKQSAYQGENRAGITGVVVAEPEPSPPAKATRGKGGRR